MHFNFTRGEYNPSSFIRAVQIFLLILILIGIGLLVTQKVWVPKLVEYILSSDTTTVVPVITEALPKEESVVVPSTQNTVDPRLVESPVVAESPVTSPKDGCHIGGCSAQLCTEQPDMMSTCEYRAEYACYQTAECKRQTSGQCGWTQTSELHACLDTKPNIAI
jgi:hypothetical protein